MAIPETSALQDRGRLRDVREPRKAGESRTLHEALSVCQLCPRACGVDRTAGVRGVCGAGGGVRLARAALHFWEEPCISGDSGSGTVFFSYCPLRCVYCQNHDIAAGEAGTEVSVRRLARIYLELQEQGARNINLVTPTHYAPQVVDSLALARAAGLALPVVYNTSGYETPAAIRLLKGTVDVYLTDFKYARAETARRYSSASDYPQVALAALDAMVEQGGAPVFEGAGDAATGEAVAGGEAPAAASAGTMGEEPPHAVSAEAMGEEAPHAASAEAAGDEPPRLLRGVVVRHLLLPGRLEESKEVVRLLHERYGERILLSLMNQYTPIRHFERYPELNETVPASDYEALLDYADELGIEEYYWQEGGADSESFIPPFDQTGVLGPELG